MNIAIIGTGRMGTAQARLARAFADTISFAVDSNPDAQRSFSDEFHCPCFTSTDQVPQDLWNDLDLIWLVVCDNQISQTAFELAAYIHPQTTVFHTSGALSAQILKQALPNNPCASLHPLIACPLKSVSDDACVETYQNIIHSFEGDDNAINLAKQVVSRINGQFVQIQSDKKVLYHAAAVFASNYPITLLNIASILFQNCGMPQEMSIAAARRLLRQTDNAIQNADFADALTGPAKRRDTQTIARHQQMLQPFPQLLDLYNLLLAETQNMLDSAN